MPVSESQARQCLDLVRQQFAGYIDDGDAGPLLRPDAGRPGGWLIVWESNAPSDWPALATSGGVDEEMACMLEPLGLQATTYAPVQWPPTVEVDCVNSITLMLY